MTLSSNIHSKPWEALQKTKKKIDMSIASHILALPKTMTWNQSINARTWNLKKINHVSETLDRT